MKKIQFCILLLIICLFFVLGCAGNNIKIQNKIRKMSDKELISHYQVIEMSIVDTDRTNDRTIEEERRTENDINPQNYNGRYYNLYQGSLYLREEKKLILQEMNRRGISPPRINPNN